MVSILSMWASAIISKPDHSVKVTIEKHHSGQVFVHSKEGEGSIFGFRLPINITQEELEEYLPKNSLPAESEA